MIVKTNSFSYAKYWSKSVSFSSGSGYWSMNSRFWKKDI